MTSGIEALFTKARESLAAAQFLIINAAEILLQIRR